MNERDDEHGSRALVCSVGSLRCGLPLSDVVETMRPLPAEPLERAPSFVSGLSIIRGEPVVVVDAAGLLGVAAPDAGRIVILRVGDRHVALAVTAVVGVRELQPQQLTALPPLLADASPAAVATLGRLDSDLLVVLSGAHLIPSDTWEQVDLVVRQ